MAESTIHSSSAQQPTNPVVVANWQAQGEEEEEVNLKYLDFVQVLGLHALMQAANLYNYAKDKSGPLKPRVDSVEGTVKTAVGPVYNKFHDVPIGLLKFVDRKVDDSVNTVQSRVPPSVKTVSAQVMEKVQEAPKSARSVMWDVKNAGVVETASGMARTMYTKYEPVAEQYAVSAWQSLNRLPFFPRVAQTLVVPTASYCSDKYNEAVKSAAEKGYRVATHLPLVPVDKISHALST